MVVSRHPFQSASLLAACKPPFDRPITEAIEVFRRYLTYARVSSGEALKSARADYEDLSKRKFAVRTIPTAWRDLASEPDTLLMDLVSEKVESLSGYRPGPEDVEEFLVKLAGGRGERRPQVIESPILSRQPSSAPLVSERSITFKMFGQSKRAENLIEYTTQVVPGWWLGTNIAIVTRCGLLTKLVKSNN